jgi:hypothetical protein
MMANKIGAKNLKVRGSNVVEIEALCKIMDINSQMKLLQ